MMFFVPQFVLQQSSLCFSKALCVVAKFRAAANLFVLWQASLCRGKPLCAAATE